MLSEHVQYSQICAHFELYDVKAACTYFCQTSHIFKAGILRFFVISL